MGTIGEYYADGIKKCTCGCTDLVIEKTSYLFIERDTDLSITKEFEGNEEDIKITCRKCEKEVQ